jgi:hypothetical protein
MAPLTARSCSSRMARQFAPALQAISSLVANTGFTCRFTRCCAGAATGTDARKGEVFEEWIRLNATM